MIDPVAYHNAQRPDWGMMMWQQEHPGETHPDENTPIRIPKMNNPIANTTTELPGYKNAMKALADDAAVLEALNNDAISLELFDHVVRIAIDSAGPEIVRDTQDAISRLIRPADPAEQPADLSTFSDAAVKVFRDYLVGVRRLVRKKDYVKASKALDAGVKTFDGELINRGTLAAIDEGVAFGSVTPSLADSIRRNIGAPVGS